MTQHPLPLDGRDAGPLFAPRRLTRPPVRPKGKEGVVHRAQTRRATPAWADLAAIRAIYAEARRLTRETGVQHVVDHVVPKIGRGPGGSRVAGLHVPWNLQILTAEANLRKGAWFWPDQWTEQLRLT